jgi:hypothetical protein
MGDVALAAEKSGPGFGNLEKRRANVRQFLVECGAFAK